MSDRLTYSVDEAAYVLGIGRTRIYALVNSGEIPVVRVGRRILIPRAAIVEVLRVSAGNVEHQAVDRS